MGPDARSTQITSTIQTNGYFKEPFWRRPPHLLVPEAEDAPAPAVDRDAHLRGQLLGAFVHVHDPEFAHEFPTAAVGVVHLGIVGKAAGARPWSHRLWRRRRRPVPVGEESLEHDTRPDRPLLHGHGPPPFVEFVRVAVTACFAGLEDREK